MTPAAERRCPWDGHRCVCVERCKLDVNLEDTTLRMLDRAFADERRQLQEATR